MKGEGGNGIARYSAHTTTSFKLEKLFFLSHKICPSLHTMATSIIDITSYKQNFANNAKAIPVDDLALEIKTRHETFISKRLLPFQVEPIPSLEQSRYERISSEVRRIYLDIDGVPTSEPFLILDIVKSLKDFFKEEVGEEMSEEMNFITTFNGNSETHAGFSFHLYCRNYSMNVNNLHNLLAKFVSTSGKRYADYIDMSLYSKVRLFKIPYYLAIGKDRVSLSTNKENFHRLINCGNELLDLEFFKCMIVQNTAKTHLLVKNVPFLEQYSKSCRYISPEAFQQIGECINKTCEAVRSFYDNSDEMEILHNMLREKMVLLRRRYGDKINGAMVRKLEDVERIDSISSNSTTLLKCIDTCNDILGELETKFGCVSEGVSEGVSEDEYMKVIMNKPPSPFGQTRKQSKWSGSPPTTTSNSFDQTRKPAIWGRKNKPYSPTTAAPATTATRMTPKFGRNDIPMEQTPTPTPTPFAQAMKERAKLVRVNTILKTILPCFEVANNNESKDKNSRTLMNENMEMLEKLTSLVKSTMIK